MKTLVTGATGLVGGNIVHKLVSRGEDVRVLIRKTSNTKAIDGLKLERAIGDIRDPESVRKAMQGVGRVYHSAASVTMWSPDMEAMRAINVTGTVNVLQAAMDAGVERVVHVSTVDALGLRDKDNPADETVEFNTGHMGVGYMITKHEAQQRVLEFVEKGLDVVITNPTYMLGPYDTRPSSGQMILEVSRGLVKGYPGGGNNFVDVEDVVDAMIAAMDKGRKGELYILGNENLTYKDMLTRIANIVGAKPPSFRIPYPIAMIGGAVMSAFGKITGKQMEVNLKSARLGYVYHYFDPSKARRELGLKEAPIEAAIEKACKWFKDNGYI